jgi:hypothetical protein
MNIRRSLDNAVINLDCLVLEGYVAREVMDGIETAVEAYKSNLYKNIGERKFKGSKKYGHVLFEDVRTHQKLTVQVMGHGEVPAIRFTTDSGTYYYTPCQDKITANFHDDILWEGAVRHEEK